MLETVLRRLNRLLAQDKCLKRYEEDALACGSNLRPLPILVLRAHCASYMAKPAQSAWFPCRLQNGGQLKLHLGT